MPWNAKLLAAGLLVLCSVLSPFVSEVIGENADKELNKLQGTWVMVSGEWDGKKVADEHVSRSKLIYEGNQGKLTAPHQSKETIAFDIVKIDPTKNPKEMHIIRKNGPNAGKTIIGIYEFDGNDQFKFAFDTTVVTTLKEFATKEGTGYIRQTWKRVKP
ncbi:MAG: TIGR03067 domain-containing protein [Deltaproteobacteria bacterium]|nr:TIGR03067 domain-containing protein [Deltaproteobacteria bacterium]